MAVESYFLRLLMFGSSAGVPYWHQPTHSPSAYTRIWWTVPAIVWARFASRLPSGVWPRPTPSGWNPMHQHPPHTPLWASTSAAKSAHVSAVRGLVVKLTIRPYSDWPGRATTSAPFPMPAYRDDPTGGPGGAGLDE